MKLGCGALRSIGYFVRPARDASEWSFLVACAGGDESADLVVAGSEVVLNPGRANELARKLEAGLKEISDE